MAAQFKEIVIDANGIDSKHVRPDLRNQSLRRGAGGEVWLGTGSCRSSLGYRLQDCADLIEILSYLNRLSSPGQIHVQGADRVVYLPRHISRRETGRRLLGDGDSLAKRYPI